MQVRTKQLLEASPPPPGIRKGGQLVSGTRAGTQTQVFHSGAQVSRCNDSKRGEGRVSFFNVPKSVVLKHTAKV